MKRQAEDLRSAVALAYHAGGQAPQVVASGKGAVAERIIELARENGVYVHESRELVALLMDVELDSEIPPSLYRAVAELLAWLYQIEAALPPTSKPAESDHHPPSGRT
jgi:flagellar biosynthesis protein